MTDETAPLSPLSLSLSVPHPPDLRSSVQVALAFIPQPPPYTTVCRELLAHLYGEFVSRLRLQNPRHLTLYEVALFVHRYPRSRLQNPCYSPRSDVKGNVKSAIGLGSTDQHTSNLRLVSARLLPRASDCPGQAPPLSGRS